MGRLRGTPSPPKKKIRVSGRQRQYALHYEHKATCIVDDPQRYRTEAPLETSAQVRPAPGVGLCPEHFSGTLSPAEMACLQNRRARG
jgi:hypothetical protein